MATYTLTTAEAIQLLDKITASYLAGKTGLQNAVTKLNDQLLNLDTTATWGDYPSKALVMTALNTANGTLLYSSSYKAGADYGPFIASMNILCAGLGLSGVTSLATYLAYYNYGTAAWTALQSPDWGTLFYQATGTALDARNIYSPAISSMATLNITGAGTGTYAHVADVDTTAYAGVAAPQITTGGSFAGSGVVTVTGAALKADGTAATGRTWTVTASASGTTYDLVPTVAGDILTAVSGIGIAAGITAGGVGGITVKCTIPSVSGCYSYLSGRTSPPS